MAGFNYEIIRQIACGGMAEVLLARQHTPDGSPKLVVVKRVLQHLAQNDNFLQMFSAEARIASSLRHPNIVQVLEVGEIDALPFIAMERLDGADLLRLLQQCVLRRQNLGIAVGVAILAGAARGLGYAHRARSHDGRALRIIHRDVSPHNIFVTRDGGVKLLDFGIAKSVAHVGLTSTGQVKGKVSYMSPEQIRARPIDSRSDLWSLGVVLWETIAGDKLFSRDNDAATLHAILHDDIPPLNRPELPELDALISAILQREPDKRIATAEEIADALDAMFLSLRAGPGARLIAQRVSSLIPAINPELDVARPIVQRTPETITIASSEAVRSRRTLSLSATPSILPPTRAPTPARAHTPARAPTPARAHTPARAPTPARAHTPAHTPARAPTPASPAPFTVDHSALADDVAIDDEPTQLQIQTVPPVPPSHPPVFATPPTEAAAAMPPLATSSHPPPLPRSTPAPTAEVIDPPTRPFLSNPPPEPIAQRTPSASLGPPPSKASTHAVRDVSADPFGAVPPTASVPPLGGQGSQSSPVAHDPLAGFGVRPPDTLASAELHRVAPRHKPQGRRTSQYALFAIGACCFLTGIGIVAARSLGPSTPAITHSAAANAQASVATPAVPTTPEPPAVPEPAVPEPPAAPEPPAVPVPAVPAPPAAPVSAVPAPPAVPVAVAPVAPAAVPPEPIRAPRPAAQAASRGPVPMPELLAETAPARAPTLTPARAPTPTPARAPTPTPARSSAPVAAPNAPRPVIASRPVTPTRPPLPESDPFNSTFSDPSQRTRPQANRPRPPVAPPSAHSSGIITEL